MRGTQARMGKRVGAALLALFIFAGIIPLDSVWFGTKQVNASEMAYIMETSNLTAFSQSSDGTQETVGSNGNSKYFTLLYSSKSKTVNKMVEFEDGYKSSLCLDFGGKVTASKNSVMFTTSKTSTVKVWWVAMEDNAQLVVVDNLENQIAMTNETPQVGDTCISSISLADAGKYYIGGNGCKYYIYKIEVTEVNNSQTDEARPVWSSVSSPRISVSSVYDSMSTGGAMIHHIYLYVYEYIGYAGADEVIVTMTDSKGNSKEKSITYNTQYNNTTVSFEVLDSDTYTFYAKAIRYDEEVEHISDELKVEYTIPLDKPAIKEITNLGNGSVAVVWYKTAGASFYRLTIDDTDISVTTSEITTTVTGLETGKTYNLRLVALRGNETSAEYTESYTLYTNSYSEPDWGFVTYGKNNIYSYHNYNEDGSVTITANNLGGLSIGYDGLEYFYTTLDATQDFKLSADIHVNNWEYGDGQSGLGIMASDTIGINGINSIFWNNSFQVAAASMQYYYGDNGVTDDENSSKIDMNMGIGAIVKTGVTYEDYDGRSSTFPLGLNSTTDTLETSCGGKGTGTYNIIGNNSEASSSQDGILYTDLKFSIERKDNKYTLSAYDADGMLIGQKTYYDSEGNALTQIDGDNIYVGFFVAKYASITVSNISLSTGDFTGNVPSQNGEIKYVAPSYKITSATSSSTQDYNLVFKANADGKLSVSQNGTVISTDNAVVAGKDLSIPTTLANGDNLFNVTFTPNENYMPDSQTKLSSYNTATLEHKVTYNSSDGTDNKDNGNNNSGSGNTDNKNNNINDNEIGNNNNSNNTDKNSGSGNIADNGSVADKNDNSSTNNNSSNNIGNDSSNESTGNDISNNVGSNNNGNASIGNVTGNNGNGNSVTDINDNNSAVNNNGSIISAGSNNGSSNNNILTSDDISGADNIQIDDVGFTQIGDATLSASEIMSAINDNGQIVADVDVMQTSQEINKSVLENVNDTSADSIAIFASEDASISADVINSLVKTGKTLSVGIVDKNGKVNAILTLDGNDLNSATSDFELAITVDTQDIGVTTLMANYEIPMSSYSIIGFDYSGNLPGTFKVAVDVSDKFADGTQLALYYNNSVTGALENQYQVTTVSGGYAEFAINHCSEYVLMDVSAARSMITSSTLTSPKTGDTSHIVFWISMMGAILAILGGIEACASERKRR